MARTRPGTTTWRGACMGGRETTCANVLRRCPVEPVTSRRLLGLTWAAWILIMAVLALMLVAVMLFVA